MQNGENKRLPDLPKSNHRFWDGAEKYSTEMMPPKKCEHIFEYKTGREVYCRKCNIGFYFSGKENIKEGHIYIGDQFVV